MRVAVVGGGVAGLAAAFHLRARGVEVEVFEASGRPGGVVRTLARDGALIEQGPQSLRSAAGATARLVQALDLVDEVVGPAAEASRRYLLLGGRLRPLPAGPLDLFRGGPIGPLALLRLLIEPLVPRRVIAGESIAQFVARRLGPRIAYPLIDAFVAGIYAGDAERTEASAAFPALVEAERTYGSVLLGLLRAPRERRPAWLPRVTFTFRGGAQALTDRLAGRLGDALHLGAPVERVEPGDEVHRVWIGGRCERFDRVVLAVPPAAAATVLPALADELAGIPSAPVAAIHLGWPAGHGPPQRGFGWLAPSRERRDVLGAIWVTRTFPHLAPDHDLVRVMVGGARAPELVDRSEQALVDHALAVIRAVQGPVEDPSLTQVAVHRPGIPQYLSGHSARITRLAAAYPGVSLLGWGYGGIGLSQGLAAAEQVAESVVGGFVPGS